MDYSCFLSKISAARQRNPLRMTREVAKKMSSLIMLSGGMPNADCFPIKTANVTLADKTTIEMGEQLLKMALQYSPAEGIQELLSWLEDLQMKIHDPPTAKYAPKNGQMKICITSGGQDGLSKVFDMLINPGDHILIDEPNYTGVLMGLKPLGCTMISIPSDEHGLIPKALKEILSRWRAGNDHQLRSKTLKCLYTVPNGGNPSGSSLTADRKKEIYQLATEYNFLIIEDDPYYFLQYEKTKAPSFLSLDVDGRVIRCDSISKVLFPGLRIGFVTGPAALIDRIILHTEVSTVQTSTFTQVLLLKLLKTWGQKGFLDHANRVATFYRKQRDALLAAADKWLKGKILGQFPRPVMRNISSFCESVLNNPLSKQRGSRIGLAEWDTPNAGLFLWIKIKGISDTHEMIITKAQEKGVLLLPGRYFMIDSSKPSPYIRAAFSFASPDQMDQGFQRLAELIREEIE